MKHHNTLKRKNFWPTLILTVVLWLTVGSLIYFVDPETAFIIPLFFTLVFFTFLFTFAVIFAQARMGFLTTLGLTFFLVLRYFGIGNIINFILILAILTTLEIYLRHK